MSNAKESNQENKAREIATVALGCLLHDIGKPIQRADNAPFNKNHSRFGRDFIDELAKERHLSDNLKTFYWKAILDSIRYHHAKEGPSNADAYFAYIACEADNLASAHDRKTAPFLYDLEDNRLDECDDAVKSKWDSERRLESIFTYFTKRAQGNDEKKIKEEDDKSFYDLWLKKNNTKDEQNENSLNPYPYPTDKKHLQTNVKKQYETIRDKLRKLVEDLIEKKDFGIEDLNKVSYHLEELFQFIPPDTYTGHTNDVSLYEHLKLTAAIGSCMFSYIYDAHPDWLKNYTANQKDGNPWNALYKKEFRNEKAYVLFKADISGIQEFIYNISSKQALKGLRGRSFYLELLCQQIADEILKVFSLGRVNQIYLGGGGFSLLLPNTKNLETDLNKIEEGLNKWLLEKHDAKLSIAFGYTVLSGNEIRMDSEGAEPRKPHYLNTAWEDISKIIGEKKLSKFKNNLNEIFSFSKKNHEECKSCHKETSNLEPYNFSNDGEKLNICHECKSLIEYGEIHAEAEKIFLRFIDSDDGLFPSIGLDLKINSKALEAVKEKELKENTDSVFVIHDSHKEIFPKIHASVSVAKKGKDTACFTDLAAEAKGVKRIGVLRADIDNLGKIFKSDSGFGFQPKYKSLSRDKSLSRNLAKFFTHYLDDILKDSDLENCITVVYAGGDDLFLVGAWDKVIEAAFKINEKFREYTLGAVSLSAGISIHNPKFPLYRMAEAAGLAESVAKSACKDTDGKALKNSLCIFFDDGIFRKDSPSHVFLWEDWKNIQDEMKLLESFKLPSAYLYQILIHVRELIAKRRSYHFPRLIYATARMEEENETLKDLREEYDDLRDEEKSKSRWMKTWVKFRDGLFECFEKQESEQGKALLRLRKLETALNYLLLLGRESEKGEYNAI